MRGLLLAVLAAVRVFFRSRAQASLEALALRQQVAVLKRQRPRPTLTRFDRVFWTTLRHVWSRWADVLLIVKPETVIRWHRAGFRLYWRWRSCRSPKQLRSLPEDSLARALMRALHIRI